MATITAARKYRNQCRDSLPVAPPDVLQLGINKARQKPKGISHSGLLTKRVKQHKTRANNPVNSHVQPLPTQDHAAA